MASNTVPQKKEETVVVSKDIPGIVKGYLEDFCEADIVVNSAPPNMKLNSAGLVSQAILSRAGNGIQEECDEKYPNGIQHLEVAVTYGHKLPYSLVFHCTVNNMNNTNCFTDIAELIKKCLHEADGKQFMKHNGKYALATTIAFPLLGTGAKNLPDAICRTFYRTILSFLLGPTRSLENAYIIVTPRDKHLIQVIQGLRPLDEFNAITYELSYPSNWQPTANNLIINLSVDSEEYMLIKEDFTNFGPYNVQVSSIERIQNKTLYKTYLQSKCQYRLLQKKYEKKLWMNCDANNVIPLYTNGIDNNHVKVGRCGDGYYFYLNSELADDMGNYPSKSRKMFYCSVLVGSPIPGQPNYNTTNFPATSTSAVDNIQRPSMYTIFKENLFCPNYVVSYVTN